MKIFKSIHPGLLVLAFAIAVFLWGIASGSSNAERGFDIPVVLDRLPDALVVTDQSSDAINVRVMGSRAVLRSIVPEKYKYDIDVSGGKPGVAVYEIELARIDLPRGANFVAHSPSRVQVRFEKRGRKAVPIKPELEGTPAAGFRLLSIEVTPPETVILGALSQVMRLDEVGTETIDLSGLNESITREVRVIPGRGKLWVEDDQRVTVQVLIESESPPEPFEQVPLEGTLEGAIEAQAF